MCVDEYGSDDDIDKSQLLNAYYMISTVLRAFFTCPNI